MPFLVVLIGAEACALGYGAMAGHALLMAALAAAHVLGGCFTAAAIASMGRKNPRTHSDSYSGDDTLDALIVYFWPVFWPCFAAYRLGQAMTEDAE